MIELELKLPPSANHYWRKWHNRLVVSKDGRQYQQYVAGVIQSLGIQTITGAIAVYKIFYCPDMRRRDLDNLDKVLYDACTKAKLWEDDSFIAYDKAEKRLDPDREGRVILRVKQIDALTTKAGAWLQ